MRKLTLTCAAFAVLIQACAPSGPFYVDSRFTPDEQLEIQRASDTWAPYGGHIDMVWNQFVVGNETNKRVIARVSERGALNMYPNLSSRAAGYTHYDIDTQDIIIIPERIHSNPLWYVVAHEFGHALGMDHVSDPRAIMFETNTDVSLRCVTRADLQELCRVSACVRRDTCTP